MRLERYAVAAALLLAACSDPSEPDNPSPFIGRWDFDPAVVLDCPEGTDDVIVRRLLIEANGRDSLTVDVVVEGLLPFPYTLEIDIENPTGRSVALADTIPLSEPFPGFTVSGSFDLAGTLQPGDSLITGTAQASLSISDVTCPFPEGPFQARRAP